MDEQHAAETDQRIANLARFGKVAMVDTVAARVRVALGDVTTDWIPWLAARAGANGRWWWAPAVGEQVLVLALDGEPRNGVVVGSLYQLLHPAPSSSATVDRVVYPDGTAFQYDAATGQLDVTLREGGKLVLTGDVEVHGDVAVVGDLHADGDLLADGDVADGVASMAEGRTQRNTHTHAAPGGPTGTPTPTE